MVDRHLAFDDPTELPDEPADVPADRPAARRRNLAAVGGIAGAVLIACLVSGTVVLISPRAASTATETRLATGIGSGASAVERGAPLAFSAARAVAADRDSGVPEIQTASLQSPATDQTTPSEDGAGIEPASDPDTPPPRENDGRWWTFLSDYSTGTWPEPVELPRARPDSTGTWREAVEIPRTRPDKQPATGKHRSKAAKTGHPHASVAAARKPGSRPATPRPLRLSDVVEPVPYPPPVRRPVYSRIGCWTDEGNRWLPCGP